MGHEVMVDMVVGSQSHSAMVWVVAIVGRVVASVITIDLWYVMYLPKLVINNIWHKSS